ncbi:MarR family transcriptional regulator [Herbiconiux sp. KACC 21604]|uniref:MarR family winged helix-turn-helix transcriptional regulator n=1 Tax=unclassified Herbiconiux TaxID=2618217 RepID=UPI001492B091|nr:MarR family transcriptional regulator [Herbiconiux sp. SALV-R1]QJU53454.1 MarR family transcriptional regulator [Herbiconiux sp. SALV-R1]WPO88425.1 MarR family transcriptional regulator [Herbiconiux sp. KACC 21604]
MNSSLQHSADDLVDALTELWNAEVQRRREITERTGLSANDEQALEHIVDASRAGEGVSPKSLAAGIGITSASITVLIDRLERRGLVTRAVSPSDRRALSLHPTQEGASLVESARGPGTDFVGVLKRMGEAERESGIRFLHALSSAIGHRAP